MNNIDISDPNWYADNGATAHMKSNSGNLVSSSLYNFSKKILFVMVRA